MFIGDNDLFGIRLLVKEAIKNIESLMNENKVNELGIDRNYLPEIFSTELIEFSTNDGLPKIKQLVFEPFWLRNLNIRVYDKVIEFERIDTRLIPYSIFSNNKNRVFFS